MQIEGKVAVILGASQAGSIGWETAEQLASEGAKVVVAARRGEPLKELAEKIGGLVVVCDAGRQEDIAALARSAAQAYGKIDIAVNCAFTRMNGLIHDLEDGEIRKSLDVNFIGQVHFVRHMAEIMNDGGSIILISSAAATQPMYGSFAYGCAKAATDCLVRYAALEYGPRGIRVNSILPGPVRTSITSPRLDTPAVKQAFMREIPLGRMGVPADCAQTVLWLSRPGFISGVNLPVSGGMHLNKVPRLTEIP